jgi:hypothetical protein
VLFFVHFRLCKSTDYGILARSTIEVAFQ